MNPDFPGSKTLHPDDYKELEEELKVVREFSLEGQHEHRAWEYAMALRAYTIWQQAFVLTGDVEGLLHYPRMAFDVGGAGSPLARILCRVGLSAHVIDPKESISLEKLAKQKLQADVVTCVSVLEHVAELQAFLHDLAKVTAPGGLLFLTADIQGEDGPDKRHFHWMRERIFSSKTWAILVGTLIHGHGFEILGKADPTWNGPHVYDYSFVSTALVKKKEREKK